MANIINGSISIQDSNVNLDDFISEFKDKVKDILLHVENCSDNRFIFVTRIPSEYSIFESIVIINYILSQLVKINNFDVHYTIYDAINKRSEIKEYTANELLSLAKYIEVAIDYTYSTSGKAINIDINNIFKSVKDIKLLLG